MKTAFFITLVVLLPPAAAAGVIHVPADLPTIQAGIDAAADGDIVMVADGTYTGEGNKNLNPLGKEIAIRSENGAAGCIIDCEGSGRGFFIHSLEGPMTAIQGFTIRNGDVGMEDGGGILCADASPTIVENFIEQCDAYTGGGIWCTGSPFIANNSISSCHGEDAGGGIYALEAARIDNNSIYGCTCYGFGGAIRAGDGTVVTANTMAACYADDFGGGICFGEGTAFSRDNIIKNNLAMSGGGMACMNNADATSINDLIIINSAFGPSPNGGGGLYIIDSILHISNATIADNFCTQGEGGPLNGENSTLNVTNSIIWDNEPITSYGDTVVYNVTYCDWEWPSGPPGEGNISEDPLFIAGPGNEPENQYYLSQTAALDPVDSPCLDAGDPAAPNVLGATRRDLAQDGGIVDMGFRTPTPALVAGPGPASLNPPLVRVWGFDSQTSPFYEYQTYAVPKYGVNVATGDVDGDGRAETLTGPGPGGMYGPHVRGFTVAGAQLPGLSFLAYGTNRYGVNVTSGDLDGDGYDEIITGAGPGRVFGPHVRGWDYDGAPPVTPMEGMSFFAYGAPKYGVNVSCGDIDGDGFDELITGAGPGNVYGAHVRGWNVDGGPPSPISGLSFLAYPTRRWGVRVTCGDVDGDGMDEFITAPGPSAVFGAHIRGWNYDGSFVSPLPGYDFFAWPPSVARYGATINAGYYFYSEQRDYLLVGGGPDPAMDSEVKVYGYNGMEVYHVQSIQAFPGGVTHGVNTAAGQF